MRLQHWIVPALGMVVALGGSRHVSAQYDPTRVVPADDPVAASAAQGASPFPYYDPAANGGYPAMQAGYGQPAVAPQPAVPPDWVEPGQVGNYSPLLVNPPASAGFPPGFQPYPAISPYEHRFQEHFQERGLWFQRTNDEQDQVFCSVDAFVVGFREPVNRLIGAPNVFANPLVVPNPFTDGEFAFRSNYTRDDDTFNHFENSVGLQLRLGTLSPDESGFELRGFWSGEFEDVNLYGTPLAAIDNTLLNVRNPGVAIDDGTSGGYDTQTNTPFDVYAVYDYSIQSGGATLNRWTTPFVKRDSLQVRRLYGLRYMGLQEQFGLRGVGSGLGYLIPDPPGTHPDPATITGTYDPQVTTINSSVQTHLAGPNVGFQIEIGGDNVLLRSETNVALMANHELIHLDGANLGTRYVAGYSDTTFESERDHMHVSPLFEQSVNLDLKIFEIIPYLNRMSLFEHAKARIGYTFLVVGQVARPTDTIIYNAPPENPGITVRRTHLYFNAWNFGVEFTR